MSKIPAADEQVLPTMQTDGSRRRIHLKLYEGSFVRKRRWVAWALLLTFVTLPFIRIAGEPALLLDVAERRFVFFGHPFFATDGLLLMLLLLTIFLAVMLVTAVYGRAFCGWACPQTVYLEFVFRPIERLFEGDRAAQIRRDRDGGGARRAAKNVTFAVLAFALGNVFLSYFVGTDTLARWMRSSPLEHPAGFLVMGVTALLVFLDFAWFREQMCTVACPYARLQSVLLDPKSLIVAYDGNRGEPRKKGKPVPGGGDCIDCGACVVACPTGIDIRNGLQLECVACGQCIDACNTIMPKIDRPLDLIRIVSADGQSRKSAWLRPRVLLYLGLTLAFSGALTFLATRDRSADLTVLRGLGAPYVVRGDAVQNQLRVKVENHDRKDRDFRISIALVDARGRRTLQEAAGQLIAPENPVHVPADEHRTTTLFVLLPRQAFVAGRARATVTVESDDIRRDAEVALLGPAEGVQP